MGNFRRVSVWMFLVSAWSSATCQDGVQGFVGGNVTLPCFHNNNLPVDVFWRDEDDNRVLNIENNNPQTLSLKYKGRVSSFPGQYSEGNFSIIIKNLTLEDAGTYECLILPEDISKRVTLNISEGGEATVGPEKRKGGQATVGPSGGAAGINVLHVVVLSALLLCF